LLIPLVSLLVFKPNETCPAIIVNRYPLADQPIKVM
jgi:hypothetical protein